MTCASRFAKTLAAAILGTGLALLAGCSSPPPASAPAAPDATAVPAAAPISAPAPTATVLMRPGARWVATPWSDLPGWRDDRVREFWLPFLRSCERPTAEWVTVCAEARRDPLASLLDDDAARDWLERHLRPFRVESLSAEVTGLATGYFEPLIDAVRTPRAGFRVPIYGLPSDHASRRPYWTRRQIDSQPTAVAGLRGREIAWLRDPLDALVLHIQGSGRLLFTDADGRRSMVRVAFAGHNDQPYKSVGRWLIEQGELRSDAASWPAIRQWARRRPDRLEEMLWSNPRYIFFREEPLADPAIGPRGAQGVPLTPGRSIAVDPQSVPYGTPVWLDTTQPLSAAPLRRLVIAQDTGTAIRGAVRADYFWGWDGDAEAQAGRMKQPLRMWALWPR